MTEAGRRAVQIRLKGRVQGVGFRYFAVRSARRLGLVGEVRNLPDGSVEVKAAGEGEDLERFKEELRKGPPASRVTGLEERELHPVPDWREFSVTYW